MRYCTVLIAAVLWSGRGQTLVDLRTQAKSVDFTGANTTKPFKSGTVLPVTCSVGEAFFKTDALAGSNLYACTSSNLWSLEAGVSTLAGDVSGPASANVVTQISGRSISPAIPTNGQALVWNGTANQWEPQAVSGLAGPTGPTGQGYAWRGAWAAPTAYSAYDTVSYSGSSYVAVASSTGVTPGTDGTKWSLLAQQGSGTGTVNGGAAGQLSYYASSTNALSGNANANISNGTLTLGSANTVLGALILEGSTSGAATIQPQSAGGTYNFNLPTSAGSSGQPLLSGGGGSAPMAFGILGVSAGGTGITSGTSGGVLGFTGSGALTSSAALTQNALVVGGGAGATPTALGSLGTSTTLLHGNAAGTPTFGAVSLAADVTGTLPASNGGTGAASFTANAPLIGNGSSPIAVGSRSGNTTTFATTSGGLTSGNCAKFDANGNIVDNGSTCGAGGGGSGASVKINGGAAIGPQGTLNFIPGTGLSGFTGVVNGSQIDITEGLDTAYLNTNYGRLGAANTYTGGGLQDMNAMDLRLPVHSIDPGTCTAGQIEFNSSGATGKICTATNTWTALGGGGSVTSVDGSASNGVETVQGGSLAAITTSGTVRGAAPVNAQSGTGYTVVAGDRGKLITLSNASAQTLTVPQAGTNFPNGWYVDLENTGLGTWTITPTSSAIDGAATLALAQNQGVRLFSNGTNYFTQRGIGGAGGGSGSPGSTLFSATGTGTGPSNTATETSIVPAVLAGSKTIAANTFGSGTVMEVWMSGYYTLPATADSLTLRYKCGSTVIGSASFAFGAGILSNAVFRFNTLISASGSGAAGAFMTNTIAEFTGTLTPAEAKQLQTSTVGFDFTTPCAFDITAQWGGAQASESISGTNAAAWIPGAPINAGTTGQIAYYAANGTTISPIASIPVNAGGTGLTTAWARTMSLQAAGCNNATASTWLDLPTSNAPTPTCHGTLIRGVRSTSTTLQRKRLRSPSDCQRAGPGTSMSVSTGLPRR